MDIPPFNRDFISSDKFKAHAFEQCAGYVAWWIKKGGGNIAIAARQSSADAFMGGAYALRDEIHAARLVDAAAPANSSRDAQPLPANAAQCSAGMLSRVIQDRTVCTETRHSTATFLAPLTSLIICP